MWLIETPWPGLFACLVIAGGFFVRWNLDHNGRQLVLSALFLALGGVVVGQTGSAADRIDNYVTVDNAGGKTGAEVDIDRLQKWLNEHGFERIQIEKQATDWINHLGAGEISGYTQNAITLAQGRIWPQRLHQTASNSGPSRESSSSVSRRRDGARAGRGSGPSVGRPRCRKSRRGHEDDLREIRCLRSACCKPARAAAAEDAT